MGSIVIILASQEGRSFGRSLATEYRQAAEAQGAAVEVLDLATLNFSYNMPEGGLHSPAPLEPDLVRAQKTLAHADHWVFVYPTWWGTVPARLTAFIDRTFLPGFAFQYQERSALPLKLMSGKTARLVVTMDGPGWWYRLLGHGGDRALVHSVLAFCGVRTLGVTYADSLRPRDKAPLDRHRRRVRALATRDAR